MELRAINMDKFYFFKDEDAITWFKKKKSVIFRATFI
jgi:hypothetical protein